ncbi:hypothetical protein MY1884_008502 [Beauveria asiatica]
MPTKNEIEQETQKAWRNAKSFHEIREMSQAFLEQSREGNFCVSPFQAKPLTAEQCQHIDTLTRLQSYGIIPLGGMGPTGIYWEHIDGEYVHTRKLSSFLFLIRHGVETERFLDEVKDDERLNKQHTTRTRPVPERVQSQDESSPRNIYHRGPFYGTTRNSHESLRESHSTR